MARTSSTMTSIGTTAPDFDLEGTEGDRYFLKSFADKELLLVMFICNHCPFVQLIRKELSRLGHDYKDRDVAIVAINSNDWESHPGRQSRKDGDRKTRI